MRILERYIFKECGTFFLLCLLAFTGILLTIQMLRLSDLIINRGVEAEQIGVVLLAIIPTFLELALPLATLLGLMLAFARLSGDSEVVVLRASGVSMYQLLLPVAFFAAVGGATAFFVGIQLKPWGYRTLTDAFFQIAKSRSTAGLEGGVFNKLGALTLYAEGIDYSTGELSRVMVDDRRSADDRKVIFAESGRIFSNEAARRVEIVLHNGTMHQQSAPQSGARAAENRYSLTRFDRNNVTIRPDELYGEEAEKDLPPRALTVPELSAELGRLAEAKQSLAEKSSAVAAASPTSSAAKPTLAAPLALAPVAVPTEAELALEKKMLLKRERRVSMELATRYSLPFATVILAFLALPLGVQPPRSQRTWGASISFLLGMLVFVVYYGLLSIGITMVEGGKLPVLAAAWIPNLVALLLTAYLVQGIASERIQSVAQLLDRPVANVHTAYQWVRNWRAAQ